MCILNAVQRTQTDYCAASYCVYVKGFCPFFGGLLAKNTIDLNLEKLKSLPEHRCGRTQAVRWLRSASDRKAYISQRGACFSKSFSKGNRLSTESSRGTSVHFALSANEQLDRFVVFAA